MATEADKKKLEEQSREEWQKIFPLWCIQVVFGIALSVCVLGGGYYISPTIIPIPNSDDFTTKLIYTLRCFVFPQTLLLIFAIAVVLRKRATTPAKSPTRGLDQYYLPAEKNALTNTVEQLLCILLVVLVLITYLEPPEMKIIPLLSILFATGRLFFIIGYCIKPLYRVFGIIINFFCVISMTICSIYLLFSRGLMYNIPGIFAASDDYGKTEL